MWARLSMNISLSGRRAGQLGQSLAYRRPDDAPPLFVHLVQHDQAVGRIEHCGHLVEQPMLGCRGERRRFRRSSRFSSCQPPSAARRSGLV